MRILIVVPEQDRVSGNWISALRFQQGLRTLHHEVGISGVTLGGKTMLRQIIDEFTPDVALLLHAYRSGKPWQDSTKDLMIPYVTMLTGTDFNLGLEDPEQNPVISCNLKEAKFVLLQNHLLAEAFTKRYPELATNLCTIKPGTSLGKTSYNLRKEHDLSESTLLFLCPAGIRPVKMQTELLDIFDQAAAENPSLHLAFCGPCLESSYSETFLAAIEKRPWASYLGVISPDAMAAAMEQADVIVNNSLAEGLSNSLVEATTLGIPILARDNPGNAAVVRHQENGLLYTTHLECVNNVRLLVDPKARKKLSHPALCYSSEQEAFQLEKVLGRAASG